MDSEGRKGEGEMEYLKERDLKEYVREYKRIVKDWKWLIIALCILITAGGVIRNRRTVKPSYKATAYFAVKGFYYQVDFESGMAGPENVKRSLATFDILIRDPKVVEDVISELRKRRCQGAEKFQVGGMCNRPQIKALKDVGLFSLTVTDSMPERALMIVNVWVEKFVANTQRASVEKSNATLSSIFKQRDEARVIVEKKEKEQEGLQKVSMLTANKNELSAAQNRLLAFKNRLTDIKIEHVTTVAVLKEAERLIKEQPYHLGGKVIGKDFIATVLAKSEKGLKSEKEMLSSLTGSSEKGINPLYLLFQYKIMEMNISLKSLNEEERMKKKTVEVLPGRIKNLQTVIAKENLFFAQLNRELTIAKNTEQILSKKAAEIQLKTSMQEADIELFQKAGTSLPIPRAELPSITIYLLIGLVVSSATALIADFIKRS